MKIIFITNDNSKYLYNIIPNNSANGYNSWLETIEGDRNVEFSLQAYKPMDSINMLKTILNEKGVIIEFVESVENPFHPEKDFLDLISHIEGL